MPEIGNYVTIHNTGDFYARYKEFFSHYRLDNLCERFKDGCYPNRGDKMRIIDKHPHIGSGEDIYIIESVLTKQVYLTDFEDPTYYSFADSPKNIYEGLMRVEMLTLDMDKLIDLLDTIRGDLLSGHTNGTLGPVEEAIELIKRARKGDRDDQV